ncbi:MAG TPA: Hsp70 family protein [Micromonosporaceae bacterium]|nr:Hsp70 family protein [Micromonosporaceae bacterium]
MPAPPIRLGVDFGTSNTVAVVRWPDGRARPLLFDGSPLLPSAVYAEPSGTIVVGRDAVHSARLDPSRFEPNPKRRIDEGTVLLGDRELPVGELVTAVLARVAEEWHRTTGNGDGNGGNGNGRGPVEITLTCPASWGATRRLVLADAARAAGLGEVRLVVEPVAAATYFTQVLGRDVPIGSVVVVHDFGAGTFDASVVARTSSGFEVLAVDGRDDIGGLDVDEAVIKHIGAACAPHDTGAWQRLVNPDTVEDRRARRLLWDDARVAKERLSRSTTADLTVPLVGVDVHLTRDELEGLARPLIDQTVRVTQGVMRWSRIVDGRLAGVFLVGGSSRIPLVATLLHRAIGEAPVAIEQPELVVAEGSVLAGAVAVPVTAAPAPGPATAEQPRIPASWTAATATAPSSGTPATAPSAGATPPSGRPGPAAPGDTPTVAVPRRPAAPALDETQPIVAQPTPLIARPPASALPVSSAPAPSAPVSSAPASPARVPPADGRPAQPGYVAGRAQYGPPQGRPPQLQPAVQQPRYREPYDVDGSDDRRSHAGLRFLRAMLLVVLLIVVPLVSAYAAYRITLRMGG